MALFSLFKKLPTLQDDFFGKLTFIDMKKPGTSYFEGKGKFSPSGDEIEYFVEADATGPTNEQREFYNKVQDTYGSLVSKITPVIEGEFRNWKEDFKIQDFNKEFRLAALTVPRLQTSPLVWNMSFTTVHDANHQITIDFKDFEPDGILIDG